MLDMTDGEKLKNFIRPLPRKMKSDFITKMSSACMVNKTKIHSFMSGNTRIEPLYKIKIEEAIGIKIF